MNQLYKYLCFFLLAALCVFLTLHASAQQSFALRGITFRKNSSQAVARVTVTNLKSKAVVMGDDLGDFTIQAAIGDTILFKKTDYASQTITVKNKDDVPVYMQPVVVLNQVDIKDISRKQEFNDVLNDYKRTGQFYTLDPSVLSMLNSPITGLYELFGKSPAEARRFRKYIAEETEQEAVNKRYNKNLVKQVLKDISDSDLTAFMLAFTPSYADIKAWSDYDIIAYIKRSYDFFVNNRDHMKIEKLYTPPDLMEKGK